MAKPFRNVLFIDGSYAASGARALVGGPLDFKQLRAALETLVGGEFSECWYYDNERMDNPKSPLPSQSAFVSSLKLAPPLGPQFQVRLYPMKACKCFCPSCGNGVSHQVEKGVGNGLATKMLSLTYEDMADRVVLFAGDGDFYDTLDHVRNIRRKELWIVGYRASVVPDIQQFASKVIWMEDLLPQSVDESKISPPTPTTTTNTVPHPTPVPNEPLPPLRIVPPSQSGPPAPHSPPQQSLPSTRRDAAPLGRPPAPPSSDLVPRRSTSPHEAPRAASSTTPGLLSTPRYAISTGLLETPRTASSSSSPSGLLETPRQITSTSMPPTPRSSSSDLPPTSRQSLLAGPLESPRQALPAGPLETPRHAPTSRPPKLPANTAADPRRAYVGRLEPNVTDRVLRDLFKSSGRILSIRIHEGFAFISFGSSAEVFRACELNNSLVGGRRILVQPEKTRDVVPNLKRKQPDGLDAPRKRQQRSRRVYVGGLAPAASQNDLRSLFLRFGTIEGIELDTGRRHAFITYQDAESVTAALALNGNNLRQHPLRVQIARPYNEPRVDDNVPVRTVSVHPTSEPPNDQAHARTVTALTNDTVRSYDV
ncbi:hypothetical protein SDRG_05570 [Saprolegnia diclina VS20]|uniref:Meiosis regulator and mRNA stability factor 1 n=1 Tax=Saprolegnia diclina (strain VS20) TaxID=1156394 RepID=T0RXH8_SAPDV|nr:hypothetical protein SDRG_05570 [Saprolegnia diclina VS20]EQC37353.1 hypothetical protein SDRG_05570 [Saprolegnia diclina VS20]|eukprot:XP_008609515.1 hypothetical protein SDRG_05570 [Saprolegnia diclina VS20]